MAYSDGKITAPVSISDVQKCLGISAKDIGTLCTSPNINIWAKYKPVDYKAIDTTNFLNSDKLTWNATKQGWWMANIGDYGLDYTYAIQTMVSAGPSALQTALRLLTDKYSGGMNGWQYKRPQGGTTSPYRLLDFDGYNHNAPQPYAHSSTGDVVASSSSSYVVNSSIMLNVTNGIDVKDRDNVLPTDITAYDLYMGFAILKRSNNNYIPIAWVTDTQWQGFGIGGYPNDDISADGGTYVEVHLKADATYYVMPFFSSEKLTQPAANRSAYPKTNIHFLSVPFTNILSFRTRQRATSQSKALPRLRQKTFNGEDYTLTPYFDSTVSGYQGGTISKVSVWIVNELFHDGDAFTTTNRAFSQDYGSVNVPAKSTVDIATIRINLPKEHTWKVIIWGDGESSSFGIMRTMDGGDIDLTT